MINELIKFMWTKGELIFLAYLLREKDWNPWKNDYDMETWK
jgi:hypothetical protein